MGREPCPATCVHATPNPRVFGASFRGAKAQESTGRSTNHPGQGAVERERTPEGSKASKRACRLPSGEPGAYEKDGVVDAPPGAHLAPPSDHEEPSSLSTRPVCLRVGLGNG